MQNTDLHLKVARSGLVAKLNVMKFQVEKKTKLNNKIASICKSGFKGNVFAGKAPIDMGYDFKEKHGMAWQGKTLIRPFFKLWQN